MTDQPALPVSPQEEQGQSLIQRLEDRATVEGRNDDDPEADLSEFAEISWAELHEIADLLHEAASALRAAAVPPPPREEPAKAPKEFFNTKWGGKGFGGAGDYRVIVRTERKGSQRIYVQIIDDNDGVGLGFTARQMPAILKALHAAYDSLAAAALPETPKEKDDSRNLAEGVRGLRAQDRGRSAEAVAREVGQSVVRSDAADRETLHVQDMPTEAPALLVERGRDQQDEEMVTHKFVPQSSGDGNGEAGSADEEIWCADCEYHRDHQIHKTSAVERGRDEELTALVEKWRNDPITVGNDNPYFLQGNVLLNCADQLEAALRSPSADQKAKK